MDAETRDKIYGLLTDAIEIIYKTTCRESREPQDHALALLISRALDNIENQA